MKVKTSELSGSDLDWAVAYATRKEMPSVAQWILWNDYHPTTNWRHCGTLIAEHQIMICPESHDGAEGSELSDRWYANVYFDGGDEYTTNMCDSALIAACRAIVGMKFGDEIDLPWGGLNEKS